MNTDRLTCSLAPRLVGLRRPMPQLYDPSWTFDLMLLAPAFGYPELMVTPPSVKPWRHGRRRATTPFIPPGWDEPVCSALVVLSKKAAPLAWPNSAHPTAILHGVKRRRRPTGQQPAGTGRLSSLSSSASWRMVTNCTKV